MEMALMSLSSGGASLEMATAAAAAAAAAARRVTILTLCLWQHRAMRLQSKQPAPARLNKQPLQQRLLGRPTTCSLPTAHLLSLPSSSCYPLTNTVQN
jgi:hypothetical protein